MTRLGLFLLALATACLLLAPGPARAGNMDALIADSQPLVLNLEESRFIQSLPVLRVMVDDDFLPLSSYDPKTGVFQGISIDLFAYIARRIGLQHEIIHVPGLTWSDKVTLFNEGKIDVLFPTSYTEERARRGLFTDSYYTGYYSVVGSLKKGLRMSDSRELAGYRVGVTKKTAIIPFVETFMPPDRLLRFNNQHELYDAIRKGVVDVGLRNRYVFNEEKFNLELFDLGILHTISESPRPYAYYFIKSDENLRLTDIFNRFMASIDYRKLVDHYENGIDELISRYVSQKKEQRQLWLLTAVIAAMLALVALSWRKYRNISRNLATANSQLERMNITDPLTGLGSRRHFDAVLPREYARHSRSGAWLSVIMLDIDFFKQFNDSYGHIRGDECLRRVARVIGDCVSRGVDLSARYGGEEFVCLLPETDLDGALGVAEQIRQEIMALGIVHESSSVVPCVTASLGVASVKCRAADSPEQAVALADAALFRAKSGGRNRVEWAAQAAEGPGA